MINEKFESLQNDCISLQNQLDAARANLDKLKEHDRPPKNTVEILMGKLIKLQAEMVHCNDIYSNTDLFLPENDPGVVLTQLDEELTKLTAESEIVEQLVTEKCSSLEKVTEKKENLIIQQNQIHDVMQKRLDELKEHADTPYDKDVFAKSYGTELSIRRAACEKERKNIKQQMSTFLSKHFPNGDSTQGSLSTHTSRFIKLEQMVEDLITLAINKPEDPYLRLGAQHSPPHVELLLSCSIAARHPSDPTKIKMSQLHI
ncbi:centromere protein K-like [Ciona intestinalis]